MGGKPAAIPLFADSYLADTMHLTTEEHGAYLLLMMAAWRQDDCTLPNDDRKLARIAKLSTRKWAAIRETVFEFWTVEGDRIFQQRLRKERGYVVQKSEANRQNANKRWQQQDTENKQSGECERISERNAPPPPPPPKEVEGETIVSPSARDVDQVFDCWNAMAKATGLGVVTVRSQKRRQACKARLRENGLEAVLMAISHIPKSAFLRGDQGNWNGANITFFLRPDSIPNILEGVYDDRPDRPRGGTESQDGAIRALERRMRLDPASRTSGRPEFGDGPSNCDGSPPFLALVRP